MRVITSDKELSRLCSMIKKQPGKAVKLPKIQYDGEQGRYIMAYTNDRYELDYLCEVFNTSIYDLEEASLGSKKV